MSEKADRGGLDSQVVRIHTALGPVDVLYDLCCEGDTLHLKNLSVYPEAPEPLRGVLRELLASRSEICQCAREAGFGKLRITGHRTLQSTSARPGKVLDVTIKL